MIPWIALSLGLGVIYGLFQLNGERDRTSPALWIPTIWLLIAVSRSPSEWFEVKTDYFVGAGQQYLEGNSFERNIFSALLAVAVGVLFTRGKRVTRLLRENAPVVIFIGYCAISLLWSDYPDVGFKRWTKLAGDLGMILVVVSENDPAAAFKRLFMRIGFTCIPLSVVLSRYFPALGRSFDITGGRMYWTGVTANKNTLGMLCMLIALGSVWQLLDEWGKSRRRGPLLAHGLMLASAAYVLNQADSATSKSCLIIGSGLIVAIRFFPFTRKPAILHSMVIAAVAVPVMAVFTGNLLQSVGRNSTLTGRTELWSIILSQPVDRIFGAGYESFWLGPRLQTIWKLSHQPPVQAHNGYIEILINLGWVGIVMLGVMILGGYFKIVRALRWDPDKESLALALFTIALIYNMTEAAFKMSDAVWLFFLWAVVSTEAKRKSSGQRTAQVRVFKQLEWYSVSEESEKSYAPKAPDRP